MKVLHVLASNKYSGAENVVCQIISMFESDVEMAYCSLNGDIKKSLKERGINFFPLKKLNKKELNRVVKEFKPDIIHAHDIKATILCSRFAKKINVISHLHVNDKKRMSKLSIKSVLYYLAIKRCKHVFTVSQSCYNDFYFKSKIKDKVTILNNIINTKQLIEKANTDKQKYNYDVCFLGRITEQKNPLRLMRILHMLANENKKIRCAIIGDGSLRSECEEYVKLNKLQDNIYFLGFQSNPYKILKDSKVMLMSSYHEGTPMAILESFALGIPIISTRVDGAVELITDKLMGGLYDVDEDAVKQILNILDSDKMEYVKYLTDFSEKYNNIEKYKKILKNIYINI